MYSDDITGRVKVWKEEGGRDRGGVEGNVGVTVLRMVLILETEMTE